MDERMSVFDEDYETAKNRYWKERDVRMNEYWKTSSHPSHSEFAEMEKPFVAEFKKKYAPRRVAGEQVSGKVRKLKALRDKMVQRGTKGGLYYESGSGKRVYVKE